MVANILPTDTSSLPRPWGQNSTFSEEDHVAYRIKGKTRMQQLGSKYFSPQTIITPRLLGWGQKVKIKKIQNMIMLHIKLKGNLECNNMVANILPADHAPPSPRHFAYQIKGNHKCSNMVANILPADPPPHLWDIFYTRNAKGEPSLCNM